MVVFVKRIAGYGGNRLRGRSSTGCPSFRHSLASAKPTCLSLYEETELEFYLCEHFSGIYILKDRVAKGRPPFEGFLEDLQAMNTKNVASGSRRDELATVEILSE